jgi:valyl-tRNA synthetase
MSGSKKRETKHLSTVYNPEEVEKKWYEIWEKKGFFSSENNMEGEPFAIVMPPPNVTGQLHMGHALDNTMQDILSRWRRMRGRRTLWLPGTDHAGIATQAKIEESLAAEGISKYDIGREAFIERAWEWKRTYHARISRQLRLLGSSCDWDKERFTLDEGCSLAVKEVFISLYQKGLIYRGNYMVNWCSQCHTTISDIEVEHNIRDGHMWELRYPYADGSGYITVATTRPETMLGDTAVAVHPDDARYRDKIGKKVILPLMQREIPIIADSYVDPLFGTGAVKITPAHDPNDFAMGLRHNLARIHVIGKEGLMAENAGAYAGIPIEECRVNVTEDLASLGLLGQISPHEHAVGECYRCGTAVEPLISRQWFVKMKPLAEPAMEAVKKGEISFIPPRFAQTYLNWMSNIRDWCVSRQLWWGHRIPVWYCGDCAAEICRKEEPSLCPQCGSRDLKQDEDVLDTWFSSALWPFSALGWPEKTAALECFYPTSVLVTAYDIIFFWVARMIFSALEHTGEKPFSHVFIHGLIRDAQGKKMSKSLGNGIDPLEMIDKYGADALRFMLVNGNSPGNDMRFQEEKLAAARNFLNKIWNAGRFTLMNLEDYEEKPDLKLSLADKWLLQRLKETARAVNANLEKYELGEAAGTLYDFVWDEFCDWYLELAKPRLYKGGEAEKHTAQSMLSSALNSILRLLHPFIPFISEEIWHALPHEGETIMLSPFPEGEDNYDYSAEKEKMRRLMDIIKAVRNIRAEMNVPLGKKADIILCAPAEYHPLLEEGSDYIAALAAGNNISVIEPDGKTPYRCASAHVKGIDILMPLEGLIDFAGEIKRLNNDVALAEKEIKRLDAKLNNENFLAKAPAEIIAGEKAKVAEYMAKKTALEARLLLFTGDKP